MSKNLMWYSPEDRLCLSNQEPSASIDALLVRPSVWKFVKKSWGIWGALKHGRLSSIPAIMFALILGGGIRINWTLTVFPSNTFLAGEQSAIDRTVYVESFRVSGHFFSWLEDYLFCRHFFQFSSFWWCFCCFASFLSLPW